MRILALMLAAFGVLANPPKAGHYKIHASIGTQTFSARVSIKS